MITRLAQARVYDPANGEDGVVRDLYMSDGRIVAPPADGRVDEDIDLRGMVLMAGAIDIHTHIGGGKVNIGRMLLPEDHLANVDAARGLRRSGSGHATPSTLVTGYRYAEMGYTACFEPAMLAANARQAHLEMGDTPMVDKGAYVLLGNDDLLLGMLSRGEPEALIRDYMAYTLHASQALAVKVVNPGGINAFKYNQRRLDLDESNVRWGVTPRDILQALTRALASLGVPHPLHVHGCNLGVPGNVETTLASMEAVEGLPVHFTHVQFHSYGTEGDRRFSSGAARIAEAVNARRNVSIDVGQIMFGQTMTESGDTMRQYAGSAHASPRRYVLMDIECEAGCGVVPFRYSDKNFVNALQWAIGLELFLAVEDPWRIFLTTDHPNGAPFTFYPHLIRLLMDGSFRAAAFERIHPDAAAASNLAGMKREYTLYEIAILTRAGPARSLGLRDRGHLGIGAVADVTVYRDDADREAMFSRPARVYKHGREIVRDGAITNLVWGDTHVVRPDYDPGILRHVADYAERYLTVRASNLAVADEEIIDGGRGGLVIQPTRSPAT